MRLLNVGTTTIEDVRILSGRKDVPRGIQKALFKNTYEKSELKMVSNYMQPGDLAVEIGVGIGLISLLLAKKIGAENVFCYEANPKLEALIRRNFELNGITPNLTMNAVTSDGRDLIFFQDSNIISSSIFDRKSAKSGEITIGSVPIDEVIKRHQPNVLVMDVEGAELELLPECDLGNIDRIIVEMHPHVIGADKVEGLLKHLVDQGFAVKEKHSITYYLER